MGLRRFATNRASAPLNAAITTGATSVVLTAGKGALFPALAAGEYFYAVIQKGILDSDVREYVKVTARAADTLTITRAQGGSTAQAFAAGDVLAAVVVADDLDAMVTRDAPTVLASAATVDLSTSRTEAVEITGSVGITSFGTAAPVGTVRYVFGSNATPPILTHGTAAGNPRLPGNTQMRLTRNERYTFVKNADGTWWLERSHNSSTAQQYSEVDPGSANTHRMWFQGWTAKDLNAIIGVDTGRVPCLAFAVGGIRTWQMNAPNNGALQIYTFDGTGTTATQVAQLTGSVGGTAFSASGYATGGTSPVVYSRTMVDAAPNYTGMYIQTLHVSGQWAGMRQACNNGAYLDLYLSDPGTTSLNSNTGWKITNGGFVPPSDRNVKLNIAPIEDPISMFKRLKFWQYNRIDVGDESLTYYGVIAQEMRRHKQLGEHVHKHELRDLKTHKKTGTRLTVNESVIHFLGDAALHQLIGKFEALEKEVRSLRAEVKRLKGKA